jgi:hypothetical protein
MNEIIPKNPISIRPAVSSDLAFIDSLQRMHSDRVGWMQTKALETKIEKGEILVAERVQGSGSRVPGQEAVFPGPGTLNPEPLGYCIGQDRYFKREDVGIVYQLNVAPGNQRGLVGASLLKAQFEKSAYGCRLYCCWCAQDIEANRFWEAMGFIALAFRAGSEKKSRVHIFWQRRIRSGDETTPYWFPSQTNGGSIREDRLVLPIQPGEHWSDAKPMFLPQAEHVKALPGKREPKPKPVVKAKAVLGSPLFFAPPVVEKPKAEKVKKPKRKNDPKLVAAARELRDRWLEQVNAQGGENLLVGCGKYDVSRALAEASSVVEIPQAKQITAVAA